MDGWIEGMPAWRKIPRSVHDDTREQARQLAGTDSIPQFTQQDRAAVRPLQHNDAVQTNSVTEDRDPTLCVAIVGSATRSVATILSLALRLNP